MPRRLAPTLLATAAVLAALLGGGPAATAAAAPAATAQPGDGPECPSGLDCRFVPAAYAQNNPADPNAYGNYDHAERPADGDDIRYIVVHDTEQSYDDALAAFQNPRSGVSAHYVIRSADGAVTQLVPTRDIAFHAGNYWFNMHSIGIEHEGVLVHGARDYTEAMYESSARLVRYLAARYHIPLDREHVIGHEEVPAPTPDRVARAHYDPGPYWDWAHYFDLLGAPLPAPRAASGPVVRIAPRFASNVEPLQSCTAGSCTDLPAQGSNVVYLHTAPRAEAPLVSDPALHPDGSPGSTRVQDWSARAVAGQSFVVAGHAPGWTAVWYDGQRVWFEDRFAAPGGGGVVIPRPGLASIPVYGAAYPEADAYPPAIPAAPVVALQYTIPAGQAYPEVEQVDASYYYARFDGAGVPGNHTLVVGGRRLVEISFNHRRAFVDAADVLVLP